MRQSACAHGLDRCAKPDVDTIAQHRSFDATHIFDRSTIDSVPLVLARMMKKRVIFKELDHRMGREIHDLFNRCRPDRTAEWQQVIVPKPSPRSQDIKKLCNGAGSILVRNPQGILVEPQDISEHSKKPWIKCVAPLCENRIQTCQPILQPPAVNGCSEAHSGFNNRHIQFIKQSRHVWIVRVVENQKTCIDRLIASFAGHNGTSVATQTRLSLEQGHNVVGRQRMRCSHP